MSAARTLRVDLLNDPIDSSLRAFAIPMAFSFLVQLLYSLIDRFYVSRLGDAAIAAIGSSDQVAFFVFTLGSGFGVGTGIIVARRMGEGNVTEAGRTATQALVGMMMLGAVVTTILYILMPYIPQRFGLAPNVATYAVQYMSMLFLGLTANLVNFQISSVVRSTGNSVYPMVILLMTTVVNAIIAPFLIFGIGPFPRMEMAGAGLATALSQILGAGFSIWAVGVGKAGIRLNFKNFKLDPSLLNRIGKQGFPASLQMLSVSLNRMGIFVIAGAFGTSVVAGYTLGLYMDMIVFMFVFATGMAVEVATGQNLGAGKVDRIHLYHRSAVKQLSVVIVTLGVVIYLFGAQFIGLYTHTPATISEATNYLHISVFGYLFFAIGVATVRVVSGAGAAFTSMGITAGSILGVQLPLAYVLSRYAGLGQQGIWFALVIGYVVLTIVATIVKRRGRWLTARV
jgi:putative MATE family efflux protein